VYDPEPILPENPLRTLSNVIMTPHLAGLVTNGRLRIGAHTVEQIKKYLAGEPLDCEVREEMLKTMA
jgi:phosphoglycerate dehydrogenase-like enzyme